MRVLKIAGAALAAVIVVIALLLVIGIPSGFLTSAIQDRVERSTGYRLTIAGTTRIGVWPSLNVTLNDVALEKARDGDNASRLTAGSIQADMTLQSVWSGRPQVTALAIVRPVLSVPLLRERTGQPAPSSRPAASTSAADAIAIDRVTVTDGAVIFSNLRDRVESRIEAINADAAIGGDRTIKVTGSARAGERPLTFEIKATAPVPPLERQNIPVELTLGVPGVLPTPLSAKAEVRINGSVVMINGLTGRLGDGAFNGWASADLSSKPLVKLDLDFQRLDLGAKGRAAASGPQQPWSNTSIDLAGLNYVDAQARISAAELNIGDGHFAPVAMEATLGSGVLKTQISNLGVYGGQGSGEITVDLSAGSPLYAMRCDLTGVRALPLLRNLADFDKLDGKLQAKLALRSTGSSQRAIMASLGGTVFTVFQDGALRGLNVAKMIRALTSGTLSGWQDTADATTDLTQLSASFRIDKGQATSNDLNLVGPLVRMTGAGTIDLPTKSLAFRVEPKLVMTTEGQGRTSDPVGLGIPVIIDGPWAEPRIYPDMAGILDNPDAAYAKLKEMGKGLFGAGGGGLNGLGGLSGGGSSDQSGGSLGETLGKLIQQGLGQGPGRIDQGGLSPGRSIPAPATPAPPTAAEPPAPSDPAVQDNQPMNEVLRQLFNR